MIYIVFKELKLDNFPEIPYGKYVVSVDNMELGESSKGDPMLIIRFEILAGEFKGQKIFYNGVMQPQNERGFGFQVHRNNEMLRKLWDADNAEVEFKGFKDYAGLVKNIADEIVGNHWEYVVERIRW